MIRIACLLMLVCCVSYSTIRAQNNEVAHELLLGAWSLDKEASIAFAKKNTDWSAKAEQQFSLFLSMNESLTYLFNGQTVVIEAGDKSMVVEIASSEQRGSGIEMILQKGEASTVIHLSIENEENLHISGDNAFAFDRLLWKRD